MGPRSAKAILSLEPAAGLSDNPMVDLPIPAA